jgi:2-dehydropantoate 2-reductase
MCRRMSAGRRYVVLGAGAVGCALGGMLQASGAPVVLLARGAQLAALQRDGLTIALPSRTLRVSPHAATSPRAIRFDERDVILVCTKSNDTEAALVSLRASAPAGIPLFCAQNGVANEPLAARWFQRVYGLVVYAPCQFLEPGSVSIHAEPVLGRLDLGCHPEGTDDVVDDVAGDLRAAGFDARAEGRILRLKYGKLLTNLGNALQAIAGRAALMTPLYGALQEEAEACYRAAQIDYANLDELRQRYASVSESPVNGSLRAGGSSWQSLARGTGSIETAFLNGEIVRLGERYGIATPYNRGIVELAERAVAEGWPPERLRVEDLEAAVFGA